MTTGGAEDDAWFQEQLKKLTFNRLRYLLRLGDEWNFFGAKMEKGIIAAAEGRGIMAGDTVTHMIVQHTVSCLLDFCSAMETPPTVVDALGLLLLEFESRREGVHGKLFAVTAPKSKRLHAIEASFYARLAVAVAELHAGGTPLKDSIAEVQQAIQKIARDESRLLPVDKAPSLTATRRWYDKSRQAGTRFGNFCAALRAHMPNELSLPGERVEWLLRDASVPSDRVDPHLRARIDGSGSPTTPEKLAGATPK